MFIDRLHFSIHDPLLRMTFFVLADWFNSASGKHIIKRILLKSVFRNDGSLFFDNFSSNETASSYHTPTSSTNDHVHPQWSAIADFAGYTRYVLHQIFCTISGHESTCSLADVAATGGTVNSASSSGGMIDGMAAKYGEQIFNWLSGSTPSLPPEPSELTSQSSSATSWLARGWSSLTDTSSNTGSKTSDEILRYWTDFSANSLQLFALWLALIFKPYFLIALLWVVEEFAVACGVTYLNLLAVQHYRSGSLVFAACMVNILVVRVLQLPAEFDRQGFMDVARNSVGTDKNRLFVLILGAHRQLSRLYTPERRRAMCYHFTSALPLLRLVMLEVLHLPSVLTNTVLICLLPLTSIGHMWMRLVLHFMSCSCGLIMYFAQSAFYNVTALCGFGSTNDGGSGFNPERVVSFVVHLGFNDYALVLWLHAAAYYWFCRVLMLATTEYVAPTVKHYFEDDAKWFGTIVSSETSAKNFATLLPQIMLITRSSYAALIGVAEVVRQMLTTATSRHGGLLGLWREAFGIRSSADTSARRRLELLKAAHAHFLLLFMHAYLMPSSTIVKSLSNDEKQVTEFWIAKLFVSALTVYVLWHIHRQLPSVAASTVRQILTESWEEALLDRQSPEIPNATTNEGQETVKIESKTLKSGSISNFSSGTKATRVKLLKVLVGGLILPVCVIFVCRSFITAQMMQLTPQTTNPERSNNKLAFLLTSFYWYVYFQTFVWLLDCFVQTALTCSNIMVFQRHMEQSFNASLADDDKNSLAKQNHVRLLCISVLRQFWQQFGIYCCNLCTIGLSGALFVFAIHPFQWTTYEYVVAVYILIRFLSTCNQLTKNILRGVKADIPCNHACVLSRLPTLSRVEIEQLRDTCAICRVKPTTTENDAQVVRLHCGHFYHKECIGDWLKIQMTCCMCHCEVLPEGVPRSIIWRPLASAAAAAATGVATRL